MTQLYAEMQRALLSAGFDPGPQDGIWGPKTRKAMQAFEVKHGLPITDTPSDAVLAALLGSAAPSAPIGWMDEATRLLGLKETPGKANNPIIMDWADNLDLWYPGDDLAWCGLFAAHCVRSALPDEPLPSNPLGARQWEKFGQRISAQFGAVATFWRGSPKTGQGHVGFAIAVRADAYLIRGGNTRDDVSDAWISKQRSTGFFWPVTGPHPLNRPLPQGGAGALSTNEA